MFRLDCYFEVKVTIRHPYFSFRSVPIPLETDACFTGKVDAFVGVELNTEDVVKCKDAKGRDVYRYDKDLHLTPDKKPKFGFM